MISEKFGAKAVVVAGFMSNSLSNLITPIAVSFGGEYALMAIRLLGGAMHGCTWAGITMVLAAWVPKSERTTLFAMAYTEASVGNLVGNFAAGLLLHAYNNWHIVFFAFGAYGCIQASLFVRFQLRAILQKLSNIFFCCSGGCALIALPRILTSQKRKSCIWKRNWAYQKQRRLRHRGILS